MHHCTYKQSNPTQVSELPTEHKTYKFSDVYVLKSAMLKSHQHDFMVPFSYYAQ
jgi:hypothetical protein